MKSISTIVSSSSSSPSSSLTFFVVVLTIALMTSPSHAYFNRMMNCQQLCEMLMSSRTYELLCMIEVCRNQKLGRHVLRYAKRGPSDWDGLDARREIPPPFDYVEKRVKEVWEGPAPADYNH